MIERCAIYIRVSTAEQSMKGHSLQAQREYLESYAASHDMRVVGIYADEGQTARKELKKRKAIHALLKDVEADKIDVILFWRMDRWFRNVADFYKVQDILDVHGVRWVSASESNINMETRDGRLCLNLILTIGQNEVDTTSERIKFTVNNMIQNGRMVWGATNLPFGYMIVEENGCKRMAKDPETACMVEEFYRFFRQTHKKRATVMHMRDTFGINFSYTMLRTMLSSEFYIGKYRSNDNYCPAYLTLNEWKEIQAISENNIKRPRTGRVYFFSGLVHCPVCGTKMAACAGRSIINRKTGEKREYYYYRCNKAILNKQCSYTSRISQNLIEEYLLNNLDTEYRKYQVRCNKVKETQTHKKKKRSADSVRSEIERLNILFQKGRIEFDYYEEQYGKLEDELKSFDEVIIREKDHSNVVGMLDSDFKEMYSSLSLENRQAFWQQIIKAIYVTKDRNVDYVDFL